MTEIQFSIVGLKNYVDKGSLDSFLRNIVGKDVIIMTEPDNIYDSRAVKVLLDGKMIGHVRGADIKDKHIHQMLVYSRNNSHSAKVTGIDIAYPSLCAEIRYKGAAFPQSSIMPDYNSWVYKGKMLKPIDAWVKLRDAMISMMTLLDNETANYENMLPLMEIFKDNVIYGFSRDFFEDRKMLFEQLKNSDDERLKHFAEEIKSLSSSFHNDKLRCKAFSKIKKELKRQVERNKDLFDCDLQDLRKQLKAFPEGLYNIHEKKFGIFPSRLYYAQIPRKQMLSFLSGIAICSYADNNVRELSVRKKRKAGRPKNVETSKDRLLNRFKGDKKDRKFWFEYMKELVEGKKNKDVAEVASAFIEEELMTNAPYDEMCAALGNIGNKNGYNCGMKYYSENKDEMNYYRDIINKKKREYL